MKVVYDSQIFMLQKYGGVSRYFIELAKELEKIFAENDTFDFPILFSQNYYLRQYNRKNIVSAHFIENQCACKMMKLANWIYGDLFLLQNRNCVYHPTWNNLLCVPAGTKTIVTVHDMIQETLWNENPTYQNEIEQKKNAIYKSDAIIAISENTKRDILKIYPDVPESKITVIYHGANQLPDPMQPQIAIPPYYILFVGRRAEYKGFQFVTRALSKLLSTRKNLKMIFVGGGKFTNEERIMFKNFNVADSVVQINASDAELSYLYQHARCFIFPSIYEGFGFPILEAFDNACPVICTNESSLPEIGGNAAVYFEKGDAEELEKQVTIMVDDEHARAKYIRKGKERVKFFTWEKCARETYELYCKVNEHEK